jgi:hypothetical protein
MPGELPEEVRAPLRSVMTGPSDSGDSGDNDDGNDSSEGTEGTES